MNRIEELRHARGLTQSEFAEFCALSRSSIARYEAGEKISRASAESIAQACGVSIDYVIGLDADNAKSADDAWELRERLRRDPDMRILFSAASKASPEHLRAAAAMLKALEPEE